MTKDTCHISAYLELYVKIESTKDRHLMKSGGNDRFGHLDQHQLKSRKKNKNTMSSTS